METAFEQACEKEEIRGAVLVAASSDGRFEYEKAFGKASPDEPMLLDSTFRIASCSKLLTSIAALQCVERGQITLDEDVTPILPELAQLPILEGFEKESGQPLLRQRKTTKLTLRQLLTHTAGMSHDFANPMLMQWREYHKQRVGIPATSFTTNCRLPLVYEPGAGWEYGAGIEWVGFLIARLNDSSLQAYMQDHIWKPLGITDMTFHLEERPDVRAKLPQTSKRMQNGKIEWLEEVVIPDPIQDDLGGCGIISTAQDFLKVLKSVLVNDGKLLQPATIDTLFQPQLKSTARDALRTIMKTAERSTGFGLPANTTVDHGLAGMLIMEDIHTGRKGGSLSWGGYPNLKWWIDRETGVCGLYASQLHPPGDPMSVKMYEIFQAEVYNRLGQINT
ncbi:beta-lactamase [Exophiala aquamarina CBS 119918]|uniref:Beta-lactamase n=1 Tax=Exophiala aquamarina CBS 119918 TaxID=1182545 RepID=A0A072P9B3_9EURO|nr:beta-lactamase [Exophiala aquamarina CBS 119918]KEF55853.1 beta-lactamase [Exophiala aquamarina CBS 119918]